MIEQANDRNGQFRKLALSLLLLTTCFAAAADTPGRTSGEPGYLPEKYFTTDIAQTWDDATIAVLPTLIRRSKRTALSFASQQQIIAYLSRQGLAARAIPVRIDLGPARRPSQWEIFEYGARRVGDAVRARSPGTDYVLVMELLIPDFQAVFGIEVYIVDSDGRHRLSFLLNEHHRLFADADLVARNSSEEAHGEMIVRATLIGLEALDAQLDRIRH